jgi:hypothetical protein
MDADAPPTDEDSTGINEARTELSLINCEIATLTPSEGLAPVR